MKQPLKYVNFYKRALVESCLHNLEVTDTLSLKLQNLLRAAGVVTPMFDTGEDQCSFNRAVVDGQFSKVKLEVIVAATDTLDVIIDDQPARLDDYFANPQVPLGEKARALQALDHVRLVNTQDLLLHDLTGQYVWVYVAVYPGEGADCTVEGIRLEFPKYSFSQYFPEIYQDDPFFDRYLAVFQSLYLDLEKQVDRVPSLLDYESTPDENVEEMASWLGIDNSDHLFTVDQLKEMIRKIHIFQGGKGTCQALEEVVRLVTGIRPRIVEQFRWDAPSTSLARRELMGRLYGEGSSQFCVILDLSHTERELPVSQEELDRLIDRYSVIGSSHRLVLLRKESHMDAHCYLDVNSCLSTPESLTLGSVTLGSHMTVGD